ncbi:MAG: hypothetical protein WD023_01705, partial [Ilumatobacteraceae bacterium]
MWAARVSWLLLAVVGGAAFGQALASHGRPVQLVGTTLAWMAWGAVTAALLVPSTVSLTVARSVVPAAVVAAVAASFGADGTLAAVAAVGTALLSGAFVLSGGFGEVFAQASAYGDERRFPLRPPVAFLLPTVVSWMVLCACAIVGPLALAARAWFLGVPLTAAALGLGWFLGRRFHRLSRRWLVLVPAGIVLHDHLVLGDTAMFQRSAVARVGLALEGTQAAALTGPAPGNAIEIELREMATVVLAPSRHKQR